MDTDHGFDWARALTDPQAFRREQVCLGGVWTLLGLTHDVAEDGCWFRATLGGRSVFVQRFGDDIRGFENLCPHRFMPLRTRDRGRGPVRCGFHHWQFNAEGEATGIPKCREMFGCLPREMGQRLRPVEVAVCGTLVFGRFRGAGAQPSLSEFLGDAFPILEAMTAAGRKPGRIRMDFAGNWRLGIHIALDDYHLVAVHPDTFGRGGYLSADAVRYYRFGPHSAYFYGGGETDLEDMAAACRAGTYRPSAFRTFHIFPNLLVVHLPAVRGWHVLIQQHVPREAGVTTLRTWHLPAPFPSLRRGGLAGVWASVAAPWASRIVGFGVRKIGGEDNRICEQIQTTTTQIGGAMVLGRHEERIQWFEEAYRAAVSGSLGGGAEVPGS